METLQTITLEQAIKNIDFEDIKNNYKTVKIKVKDPNRAVKAIEFEHCESTCMYDKTGFTYCLKYDSMPFNTWPMRDANYIQTYKSVKRMLNSLYKSVNKDTLVEIQ